MKNEYPTRISYMHDEQPIRISYILDGEKFVDILGYGLPRIGQQLAVNGKLYRVNHVGKLYLTLEHETMWGEIGWAQVGVEPIPLQESATHS